MGLAKIARHVKGCHGSQGTRVQNALDDVASNICQVLIRGNGVAAVDGRTHAVEGGRGLTPSTLWLNGMHFLWDTSRTHRSISVYLTAQVEMNS